MEKIIILLLIVVILLLLSDKMPITLSKKRTPQPKATPIPKTAPPTSVMGESRFVPPAKVVPTAIPLTEKEQQDILTEWEKEPTINLEDEEEDLRSYRTEAEDNDFAIGLSFEDLEKVATFLSEDKEEVTTENIELLQKVEEHDLPAIKKGILNMPFFVLQICGYDLFRCCGKSAVEQILNGFLHRTDGVAKRQRIFAAEKQAFIDFATESGRELDMLL